MNKKPDAPQSSDSQPPNSKEPQAAQVETKEPSLGPACLVISILLLAAFCAVCGIGSWFMFSDQYPLAEKGITQQLIPWVETSQLAESDKRSIVQQLTALLPKLQAREIDRNQLTRLHFCLQDNPILLWGGIQSILAQASASEELSQTEKQAAERVSQRLLRMATERQLSRRDLEFTVQNASHVRADGASIEVNSDLTAAQIREYMTRAEQLLDNFEIPNEPYEKTPAEAFAILIDKALTAER